MYIYITITLWLKKPYNTFVFAPYQNNRRKSDMKNIREEVAPDIEEDCKKMCMYRYIDTQ